MINNIKSIGSSLFDEIEKRFKNPFLGAFILSWLFFNWDFLYVTLFLDEKYVSLLPELGADFSTKYEYIKSTNLVSFKKFIFLPLFSTFIVILFIEWVTTIFNIIVSNIKNKILGFELLTKEESSKIKNDLVESKYKANEFLSEKNEEILRLDSKINELNSKIDEEVSKKVKIVEEKNLRRINELNDNLIKSENISSERLDKNNMLNNENKNLNKFIKEFKEKENILLKKNQKLIEELGNIKLRNNELEKNINNIDKPLDDKYKLEYDDFKNSYFFKGFDDFIDSIETHPYNLTEKFYGKDIKFLEVKGIIEKIKDEQGYDFYRFTNKGNKFVEFFLDNYTGSLNNKNSGKNVDNDIQIDDIPF